MVVFDDSTIGSFSTAVAVDTDGASIHTSSSLGTNTVSPGKRSLFQRTLCDGFWTCVLEDYRPDDCNTTVATRKTQDTMRSDMLSLGTTEPSESRHDETVSVLPQIPEESNSPGELSSKNIPSDSINDRTSLYPEEQQFSTPTGLRSDDPIVIEDEDDSQKPSSLNRNYATESRFTTEPGSYIEDNTVVIKYFLEDEDHDARDHGPSDRAKRSFRRRRKRWGPRTPNNVSKEVRNQPEAPTPDLAARARIEQSIFATTTPEPREDMECRAIHQREEPDQPQKPLEAPGEMFTHSDCPTIDLTNVVGDWEDNVSDPAQNPSLEDISPLEFEGCTPAPKLGTENEPEESRGPVDPIGDFALELPETLSPSRDNFAGSDGNIVPTTNAEVSRDLESDDEKSCDRQSASDSLPSHTGQQNEMPAVPVADEVEETHAEIESPRDGVKSDELELNAMEQQFGMSLSERPYPEAERPERNEYFQRPLPLPIQFAAEGFARGNRPTPLATAGEAEGDFTARLRAIRQKRAEIMKKRAKLAIFASVLGNATQPAFAVNS